jgi:hypothetical protein
VQAVLPHKKLVFDKKSSGLPDDVHCHPLPLLGRLIRRQTKTRAGFRRGKSLLIFGISYERRRHQSKPPMQAVSKRAMLEGSGTGVRRNM